MELRVTPDERGRGKCVREPTPAVQGPAQEVDGPRSEHLREVAIANFTRGNGEIANAGCLRELG
jgi:hypothetical protein